MNCNGLKKSRSYLPYNVFFLKNSGRFFCITSDAKLSFTAVLTNLASRSVVCYWPVSVFFNIFFLRDRKTLSDF